MNPIAQIFSDSHPKQWVATACYLALGIAVSSCSGITSTTQDANYSTHTGNVRPIEAIKKPRIGSSPLVRYYLPMPYVQVYAYEVRLLGKETLRVGFRPVVAPDVAHPYLIDHNFGALVEDNLQITTSPEGLLEYIGYRREPKAVEAAAAIARAALSLAAPLPAPFKGDDGLPEFSRLVFKQNFPVPTDGQYNTNLFIAGRRFELSFSPVDGTGSSMQATSEKQAKLDQPRAQVAGIHHRPLLPLTVSVTELSDINDPRSYRREFVLLQPNDKIASSSSQLLSPLVTPLAFPPPLIPELRSWQFDSVDFGNPKQSVLSISTLTPEESQMILKQLNPDPKIQTQPVPPNLVGVTVKEAPISISEIVYVPNPNQIDTFFLPKPMFAPQSYELNFAGGSIYDIKVRRKSEILAFANGVSDFAGSFVRIPANLFTFTVVHEEKSGGGAFGSDSIGGSKDTGDYRKKQDKDPGDYRRKVDKD